MSISQYQFPKYWLTYRIWEICYQPTTGNWTFRCCFGFLHQDLRLRPRQRWMKLLIPPKVALIFPTCLDENLFLIRIERDLHWLNVYSLPIVLISCSCRRWNIPLWTSFSNLLGKYSLSSILEERESKESHFHLPRVPPPRASICISWCASLLIVIGSPRWDKSSKHGRHEIVQI